MIQKCWFDYCNNDGKKGGRMDKENDHVFEKEVNPFNQSRSGRKELSHKVHRRKNYQQLGSNPIIKARLLISEGESDIPLAVEIRWVRI